MAQLDGFSTSGNVFVVNQESKKSSDIKSSISGVYENVENENLYEFMIAFGVPEDKAKLFSLSKIRLVVRDEGDVVTLFNSLHPKPLVIKMGQEVDDFMPLGIVLKSFGTRDGNMITLHSKCPAGREIKRIYSFSDNEIVCTITLSDSKIVARRIYKKIDAVI